ncbi:MAG: hypothetical protein AAF610_03700 [Pseudomonadota bacterium]
MPDKSVALSARLPADDADFLKHWEVEGAETPSEKLRRVVHDARDRETATHDYKSALRMATTLFGPALEHIRAGELEQGQHSELIAKLGEWLPEIVAYVYSAQALSAHEGDAGLRRLEGGIAMRVTTLMRAVLQMAITDEAPLYDPSVLDERLSGVLDTARVVRRARGDALKKKGDKKRQKTDAKADNASRKGSA